MIPLAEANLFALIGHEGFSRLVAAFYRRVAADGILRPMYPPDDLPAAEARLRDFLIFRFGGPHTYIEQRGHPRLRMRHMPFKIDLAARNRWVELMTASVQECALPPVVAATLAPFFANTATFLMNDHA